MPQLIVLAAIGAGLYAGSRLLSLIAGQLHERAEVRTTENRDNIVATKDLGRLEYDPVTGVYKPSKH